MSIKNIYAIYDQKAKAYTPPFVHATDGLAVREFQDAIKSGRTPMSEYPEDFRLFRLGHYDDETGQIVNEGNGPQIVIDGILLSDTETGDSENGPSLSNATPIQPSSIGKNSS